MADEEPEIFWVKELEQGPLTQQASVITYRPTSYLNITNVSSSYMYVVLVRKPINWSQTWLTNLYSYVHGTTYKNQRAI